MMNSNLSRHRIVEKLGGGGMGGLQGRRHPPGALRRPQVFARRCCARSSALERFRREARAASALNHPNICTLHDTGEDQGRSFMVMELLDGATL
jgi:serine/threonine protein kinase